MTNSASNKTIYVAGHNGMVGSAITRRLKQQSDGNQISLLTRDRSQLDLENQQAVHEFFQTHKIDEVYLCAARVGGIYANNQYPADFIYSNLLIEGNIINAAFRGGVRRLLFLGSSCIYPRDCPQPMQETALLTGPLESTNEPYAIAKIAGIKLCESYNRQHGTDYRSVMPTNLYGENDNFHPKNSHVIPALMRRIHEAKVNQDKSVTIWGTGKVMREFLHVDDMADASIFVMNLPAEFYAEKIDPMLSHINIGTGQDVTIAELATTLVSVIGYQGELEFDSAKPEGTPRKLLDVSRLSGLGWDYKTNLKEGLTRTYNWYQNNIETARKS